MDVEVCTNPESGISYDICEAAVPMSDYRALQEEIARLTQQNADMAAWINAQCGSHA